MDTKSIFPGGIQEQKRIKRNADGADRAHKKDFGTYWPEKEEWTRQKIKPDSYYGRVIWGEEHPTWEQEKKRKYTPEHRGSGKDKEVL